MSKYRDDEDDEERQQKILDQIKKYGRLPTPPPGYYHESDKKARKRDRASDRRRLRGIVRDHNDGFNEGDDDNGE